MAKLKKTVEDKLDLIKLQIDSNDPMTLCSYDQWVNSVLDYFEESGSYFIFMCASTSPDLGVTFFFTASVSAIEARKSFIKSKVFTEKESSDVKLFYFTKETLYDYMRLIFTAHTTSSKKRIFL
jgi:hypothetical protein